MILQKIADNFIKLEKLKNTFNRETPRNLRKSFQIINALQQILENRKTHKEKKDT
jgi:hypothetical protein